MPSTTFTVSSGSGERVVVYPERDRNSSGGSASVRSPATSESQSFSSSDSNGWTELEPPYEDDGIEPEDSASRSRQPTASRRHTTEVRPAPTRRHSSRRVVEREEPPRRQASHRHHSSRHTRRESRRVPSDESSSTVASYDDYPPGHHGMPPPQAYPPPRSGYRHVPAQSHGGYPPSMTSAAGYQDPFQAQAQALVHMPQPDAFGYPSANPFSPGVGQSANPFSPMGNSSQSGYFAGDPHAPMPQMQPHGQRPPPPGRPQSMYAPSSYSAYGSEMTAPYHHPGMPGMPYGGMPQMGGMPGMMPGMPGYPQMPFMYPQSHSSSPAPPKEEKKEEPPKDEKVSKEMEALREMIKKHEEERVAREAAMIAKAEADAAAKAAAEARAIEEAKRKEEIAAASASAKAEAEKAAAEAAKAAEAEHAKKLEEANKKHEAAETKKKELEEEVKKNKPTPDSQKAPIKFKDAVGRKFSFPWHLCKSWKGMESLIKQAFLHVDVIGLHVQEGHYDLTGPDGEIILPQVWDTMIQPDWEISMHMWPMPEEKEEKEEKPKKDKLAADAALADPFAGLGLNDLLVGVESGKKSKKKDGSKKKKGGSPEIINVGPAGAMPPPPNFPPGIGDPLAGLAGMFPPGITVVDDKKARPKAKSTSSRRDLPPLAAWIAGSSRPKKDDEKLELVRHKSNSSHSSDQTSCVIM